MNKTHFLILGLIDSVLDSLEVPLDEYHVIRDNLLATIITNLTASFLDDPRVADDLEEIVSKTSQDDSYETKIRLLSEYFSSVSRELDYETKFKSIARETLTEFVSKTSSESEKLTQVISETLS